MKKVLFFVAITITFNAFAQTVNIPDANFKAHLVSDPLINTNMDTEIQVSEAAACVTIFCSGLNISDLTGIEAFTSLQTLGCNNNQLTSLNLSSNMALVTLYCGNNQFTSLDVSNHTALTTLYCGTGGSGLITSINVTNCTALSDFRCQFNQISNLDVSTNTALTYLDCSGNNLTSLNIANGNNPNFTTIYAYTNPNLTCVQVDNATYSTTNWTGGSFQFPVGVTFSDTPCPTPPNAPSNLVANLVVNTVNLTWNDNSSDEDGFEVYAPQSLGDTSGTWNQLYSLGANTSGTTHSTGVDGLYCYKVRAFKGALYSDFTEIECVLKGTSGIGETNNESMFSIFPNPSNSMITIHGEQTQGHNFVITDLNGRVVMVINNYLNQPISLATITPGIYFISDLNHLSKPIKFIKS